MSSATGFDPQGVNDFLYSSASTPDAGAMTPRQAELNRYWGYYRCLNYDNRSTDWNGNPVYDHLEHEAIATAGYIPPGFVDKGRAMTPVKFRRPTAPYYLAKVVVDRFTGLLFGEKRQPKVVVEGDPLTTDYIEGIIEAGRFWPACIKLRTKGGGMGSAAIGFSLVDSLPTFEVFDTRWCTPKFLNRQRFILKSIEIKYAFKDMGQDEKGNWVECDYWYRRCIDDQVDVVWDKVRIVPGVAVNWRTEDFNVVEHGLGVCPVAWVPNTDSDEDIDGDPDCYGAFDAIEAYDALMAQANKGTLANSDPTAIVSSDSDLGALSKGSDNAIQVEKGASVNYLEMNGSGPKAARELADTFRDRAFEVTACVPDSTVTEGPQQTATEVVTRLSRMLERADIFREQYGELAVKRILEIALMMCRKAVSPKPAMKTQPDGSILHYVEVGEVKLPPKITEQDDGTVVITQRKMGASNMISLKWPRYMDPTLEEINKAVTACKDALDAGLLDQQTAIEYLSQYLPIANARDVLKRVEAKKAEQAKAEQEAAQQTMYSGDRWQ